MAHASKPATAYIIDNKTLSETADVDETEAVTIVGLAVRRVGSGVGSAVG